MLFILEVAILDIAAVRIVAWEAAAGLKRVTMNWTHPATLVSRQNPNRKRYTICPIENELLSVAVTGAAGTAGAAGAEATGAAGAGATGAAGTAAGATGTAAAGTAAAGAAGVCTDFVRTKLPPDCP